ncbi:MAG: Sapep family Mn(2+)-dependent dipeptidase [Anaerovoracaceae bacterium]|nr:Sapep family Mn(2+)-dependent dipeptidase [Anaerovoracaceae bacterium]
METKIRNRFLEDLKGLIQIPSVSTDKEQVENALDYFLGSAEKLGLHAEKLLDGQIGIVEMGEGAETVGILVHLDVVDIGDAGHWTVAPFDLTVKDGRVYGRGVLDDKGPAMAALYAMKAVKDCGRPLRKKVRMVIGTQEEVEWTDMNAYVEKYTLPDYSFTPDGYFPIGNVEKGYYDIGIRFPYGDEATSALPTIRSIDAGVASNVVPESCTIILSNGETVKTQGQAAHSCLPDKGINAVFLMKEELQNNHVIGENTCSRVLDLLYDHFSDFVGQALGIEKKEEYYKGEYIHKNMFTPSVIKTTQDGVEVLVNCRFAYTTSREEIRTAFETMAAKLGGEIIYEDFLPAVFVSREAPFLKELARAYETVTEQEAQFVLDYGASYCKAMPNMVSYGPIFPGMEDKCHQTDEYMPLEKMEQMYDILETALAAIVLSELSMKPSEQQPTE